MCNMSTEMLAEAESFGDWVQPFFFESLMPPWGAVRRWKASLLLPEPLTTNLLEHLSVFITSGS